MADVDTRTSLRIAEFAITHFRTFRERTVIPLRAGSHADALAVFHGNNGAGKSNALAALDLFFRALIYWMRWRSGTTAAGDPSLPCVWDAPEGFTPRRRDLPPGSHDAMVLEVRFAQAPLGAYSMRLLPSGSSVFLVASAARDASKPLASLVEQDYEVLSPEECRHLRNLLETPHGSGSRALFVLDEHRRGSWRTDDPYDQESSETLSPLLAERLLALRLSLEPRERERWRAFGSLLGRFPALGGKEISVDRAARDSAPELFFEERGRQVLRLTELSSGEQQLVTLCAAIVTSRASIVAITEPELSLSASNQRLFRDILEQQVQQGLIDQLLLESHVEVFDGPEVVRFKRENGATRVSREVRSPEARVLAASAREKGAEEEFVTAEGYTRLPESMRRELGVEGGGMVWFLKDERKRWTAWTAEELDALLGLGGKPSGEGETCRCSGSIRTPLEASRTCTSSRDWPGRSG